MRLLIAKLASGSVQSVSVAMKSENDVADIATDLDNCVRLLRHCEYDLIVMIVSQGRLRARDAIARMRREAGRVPVVVLTEAGGGEAPSMVGAVAPDARHLATLERNGNGAETAAWDWNAGHSEMSDGDEQAFAAGDTMLDSRADPSIELQPETETLRMGDRPVSLSQAEYRIFAAIWERRSEIVSAEELLSAVYRDGDRPSSRVLPVFLFKLRKKLRRVGLGDLIETAIGRGFTIR